MQHLTSGSQLAANMDAEQQRRWHSWDEYMRAGSRRKDFFNAIRQLLHGEGPAFVPYIRREAYEKQNAA